MVSDSDFLRKPNRYKEGKKRQSGVRVALAVAIIGEPTKFTVFSLKLETNSNL